jgi:hypothetical protein
LFLQETLRFSLLRHKKSDGAAMLVFSVLCFHVGGHL